MEDICVYVCMYLIKFSEGIYRDFETSPNKKDKILFLHTQKWVTYKENTGLLFTGPLEVSLEKWTVHSSLAIHFLLHTSGFGLWWIPENTYC